MELMKDPSTTEEKRKNELQQHTSIFESEGNKKIVATLGSNSEHWKGGGGHYKLLISKTELCTML